MQKVRNMPRQQQKAVFANMDKPNSSSSGRMTTTQKKKALENYKKEEVPSERRQRSIERRKIKAIKNKEKKRQTKLAIKEYKKFFDKKVKFLDSYRPFYGTFYGRTEYEYGLTVKDYKKIKFKLDKKYPKAETHLFTRSETFYRQIEKDEKVSYTIPEGLK